ncbi:microtubule associated protein [Colletotrichum tabaci]|uniref:Microtubule associated protein n=1 Tax=Colletotrichum tabaci TaxID=1209068 RepID=A0AAV9TM48_9PEZI
MDSHLVRTQSRDRERSYASPVYPRPSSRSSTSTNATRATPRSANSSTSHFVTSPRPSSAHPPHRFHHSSCAPSIVASRPGSAVSRDRVSDSGRQATAISSYLQDKLQKRREEAERLAAARAAQEMSASMDLPARHAQSSPAKGDSSDGRRPGSSGGSADAAKKTGLGAKEMEATVSTLHKQNFDLKLELFHRRERQNALEERIDALEADKAQMDEVNDSLLDELERRDKAVQEAVQMIVTLEAQVATLLKEREMVRQIDAAGVLALEELESRLNGPTPRPREANLARLEQDAKTLNRMPSFISDRTENTENLRKVYLSSRGSLLSLPRLATEAEDADARRVNTMTSPSLSVLSESSFVSVYGERDDQDRTAIAKANTDETNSVDGAAPPSRPRKPSYDSQFQSINDIIDHTSHLQALARLDHAYLGNILAQDQSPSAGRGQSHTYVKEARRVSLRKVTTDAPPPRSGEQVLPPTPDTISTSTLRRFKASNDTLSKQRGGISDQRSYRSVSDGTSKGDEGEHQGGASVSQQPPAPTFVDRKEPSGPTSLDPSQPSIPRPRSAGETTISSHRDVDWDSDGDSVHSLDSSLDIWLQQGKDPRYKEQNRSASPDLFSFPTSAGGWNTHAIFGSAGGAFDVPGLVPHHSNHAQDLMSAQESLFPDGAQQPPPPNRRSSLGAKTGPTSSKHPPVNGKLQKSPSRSGSRRNSVDAQMVQLAESVANTTHSPELRPGTRSKESHYPPSTTSASRGHRLNFFRRSIGGGTTTAQVELASPACPAAVPPPSLVATAGSMGVPSWVQRSHVVDEDRDSATPPPIMRNPRPARSGSSDEGAPLNNGVPAMPTTPMASTTHASHTPVTNGTPASPNTTPTANTGSGGGPSQQKRKWLPGFGKASSLRNRAG